MLEDLIVTLEQSKCLGQAGDKFGKKIELGYHITISLVITILSTHIHPVLLLALTTTMAVVALCDCKSA